MGICADCDCNYAEWASVNRGVLLCDDCSSVHRQLGRHVSQIKHLTKSRWRKTQLAMLRSLSQSGANKYWEHLLLESSLRTNNSGSGVDISIKLKKPRSSDAVHPTKTDFIREKYVRYGYFKKPRAISVDDLNQQLHASVRTGFLETSLYLLTLGARPNYRHRSRHTTPLHVATMYNQPLQVELLLTYGGDLLLTDGNGDTPLQIAHKKSQSSPEPLKWQLLLTCLLEAQFELTDGLSYFLCRQAIDHGAAGETGVALLAQHGPGGVPPHFLIPPRSVVDGSKNSSSTAASPSGDQQAGLDKAKLRLQALPNDAFVDLCIDVCDEVERRDINDIITMATTDSGMHGNQAPALTTRELHHLCLYFLPPNPNYSPTRNQGRQKLARLATVEFRSLCYDVLVEASQRLGPPNSSSGEGGNAHVYYHLYSNNAHRKTPDDAAAAIQMKLGNVIGQTRPTNSNSRQRHRSSLPLGTPSSSSIIDDGGCGVTDDHDPVYDQVAADGDYAYAMDLHRSQGSPFPPVSTPGAGPVLRQHTQTQPATQLTNHRTSMPPLGVSTLAKTGQTDQDHADRSTRPTVDAAICSNGVSGSNVELLNELDELRGRNKLLQARNEELDRRVALLETQLRDARDERHALLQAVGARTRQQQQGGSGSVEATYDSGSGDRFSSGPWLRQEVMQHHGGISGVSAANKAAAAAGGGGSRRQGGCKMGGGGGVSYDNSDTLGGSPDESTDSPPLGSAAVIAPSEAAARGRAPHTPDYDVPPSEPAHNPTTTGTPAAVVGGTPESAPNQVVNGVETIIWQIRALLDIANGKKRGDFLQCSRLIQTAVQQLVRLFSAGCERRLMVAAPDSSTVQETVAAAVADGGSSNLQIAAALKDLLANSRDLRVHCERRGSKVVPGFQQQQVAGGTAGLQEGAGPVIQHAHEIARAAKLLLTHYQHNDAASAAAAATSQHQHHQHQHQHQHQIDY